MPERTTEDSEISLGQDSPRWRDSPFLSITFVLLCTVTMVDRADQMLLPAVYKEISETFGSGPALLGTITLCRGLTQSLVALVAGAVGGRFNRVMLAAGGCVFWGIATFAVGAAENIWVVLAARAANGVGLGLVVPLVQAMVSDMFPAMHRGRAFGVLYFSSNVGGALGAFVALSMSTQEYWGVPGWRMAFFFVAVISGVVGGLLLVCAKDPRPNQQSSPLTCTSAVADIRTILKVPSFHAIIAQGMFGSMPWYALGFFVMWLELRGIDQQTAAYVRGAFDVGVSAGTLLGGALGDAMALRSPAHGYPGVAQFSVGIGVPLWCLILYGMPAFHASIESYPPLLFLTGLLISWCGAANGAIMAEIVPAAMRSTIYSLDRVLEGTCASMGAVLVGLLAERFGFQRNATGDANANALALALGLIMVIPWTICFLAYGVLHFTFGKDRGVSDAYAVMDDDEMMDLGTGAQKNPRLVSLEDKSGSHSLETHDSQSLELSAS